MHSQILLAVLVTMAFMGSASSQRSDCERTCGNVSIPFPFGSGVGCYHDDQFIVTCNRSSGQPIPYLGNSSGDAIIKSISTKNGEMEMMMFVAKDCYGVSGQVNNKSPFLTLGRFHISSKNRFVAIGCDTYGYLEGRMRDNENVRSGCISTCDSNKNIKNESCSGVGCCEIEIPKGMREFTVTLNSFDNHTNIIRFNPCSYAFVIQEGKYNFSSTDLLNFGDTHEKMPMLLDWAIGNSTCDQVNKESPGTLLCKGKSECDTNYTGPGYRCRCSEGYEGNPYIEDNCTNINECESKLHNCTGKCVDSPGGYSCVQDKSRIIEISVAGTSGAVLFLLIIATWVHLGLKKRKILILREKFFKQNGGLMLQQRISGDGGSQDQAKLFTLEELQKATNNYDESWIIGKGGYGTVYRGILSDNRKVAIKKSKLIDQTQTQIEQFINEVVILSQINHRNVVKLIGCCLETEVPLLVYEFIPNGTLSDHIHDERKSMEITWGIRLKIATETAGALSYLHFSASVPIIHRDVKPTNILLDESYSAKVADFGASRLIPMHQNEVETLVLGTRGYLDPEYLHSSQLTDKSDVYSFGVVLVELLTGKMVIDFDRPEKDINLTKYFLSALKEERLLEVLDEHLQLKEVSHEIIQVSRLAERCLRLKGDERPTMKEVALELEGILASMIDKHPWVKSSSNEEDTEYLLKEPMEDYYSTNSSYQNSTTFYSMIVKPSGR